MTKSLPSSSNASAIGSLTRGSAATSSRRNPFRSWNVFSASRADTGGNFGSAFGSTTRCSAASIIDGQRSGASRTIRTRAAANLELRLLNNLMDRLLMPELREQFNLNNTGSNEGVSLASSNFNDFRSCDSRAENNLLRFLAGFTVRPAPQAHSKAFQHDIAQGAAGSSSTIPPLRIQPPICRPAQPSQWHPKIAPPRRRRQPECPAKSSADIPPADRPARPSERPRCHFGQRHQAQ